MDCRHYFVEDRPIFLTSSRTREFSACFTTECGNPDILKSMSTSLNIEDEPTGCEHTTGLPVLSGFASSSKIEFLLSWKKRVWDVFCERTTGRATSEPNSFIQSCFKEIVGGTRRDANTFSYMTSPVSIRTTFGIQWAGSGGSGHAELSVVAQHLASERVREATEGDEGSESGARQRGRPWRLVQQQMWGRRPKGVEELFLSVVTDLLSGSARGCNPRHQGRWRWKAVGRASRWERWRDRKSQWRDRRGGQSTCAWDMAMTVRRTKHKLEPLSSWATVWCARNQTRTTVTTKKRQSTKQTNTGHSRIFSCCTRACSHASGLRPR